MFKRKMLKYLALGAGGVAAAYFFDPEMGRTRRAKVADQIGGLLRRGKEGAERRAEYEAGRMEGMKHKAIPEAPPENDQVLAHKVESEVLGRWGHLKGRINVNACEGVVELRGTADSEDEIASLEQDVRKVTGVIDVNNYLHREGEVAPNKDGAIHTSS